MKDLLKTKTAIMGLATIIIAIAGYMTQQITGEVATAMVSGGLTAIFLRDSIRKQNGTK